MTPVPSHGMMDMILATARLADRSGASGFNVGYLNDDPDADNVEWYAECTFQGAKIVMGGRHLPEEACLALSVRLLRGATCKCLRPISIDEQPGCRWRLIGDQWTPGCTADPLHVGGNRGDTRAIDGALSAALENALLSGAEPTNRAERRAAKRRGRYMQGGKRRDKGGL